ncbi:MAG: serine hydrolase [Chloroflexota bacterium]|nr:serine hydrolase [Chloroflexota bacterium]
MAPVVPPTAEVTQTSTVPTQRAANVNRAKRTPTDAPPTPTRAPEVEFYTVRANDSLWSVSRRYNVSLEALARENGLAPDSKLILGQRLRIPSVGDRKGLELPPAAEVLPGVEERSLTELAPQLVRFLSSRSGESAAAVYLPESGKLYTLNPNERFEMASVVKVPIMVTQLRKMYRQDPDASTGGSPLLNSMITVSDNEAATSLLREVGGPASVEAELKARGVSETDINPDAWGLSTTSAPDMALLMRSLYYGERLNRALRDAAILLMSGVVQEQRWGVPQGLPNSEVAFKGGWLPVQGGWLVHQIGVAEVGGETVIFAFLNKGQPSFEYGKQTLKRAAELLPKREQSR